MPKKNGGAIARFLRLFAGLGSEDIPDDTPPPQPGPPPWEQLEFEQKVRALAQRNEVLLTANVHILGLNHIQSYFQARWSLVAAKVHSLVTKIIECHLGTDGAYYCYQELTYIIVFAGGSKEAGKLRIALIADEVSRRLFGDVNDGRMVEVKTAVLDKSRGLGFETIDVAAIVAQAMTGELAGNRTEVRVPGEGGQADTLGTARQEAGGPGANAEKEPAAPLDPGWEDMHNASVSGRGVMVEDRKDEVSAASASLEPASENPPPPTDWASSSPYATGTIQFVFHPMWLVRQRMISAYLTVPVRVTDSGALLFGADAIPTGHASSMNADLDLAGLRQIAHTLATARPGERQPDFIASVHFITVTQAESRNQFQSFCQKLPRRIGQRIIFELVGLPRGTPQTRLYEVIPLLRAHNRVVLLRLPPDTTDFRDYAAMGFRAVGVDGHALTGSEKAIIKSMTRFNEMATRHGLQTYVHGLRSRSLTSAAVTEGFGTIGGEAVASTGDSPDRAFPFDIKNLYESLLPGFAAEPDDQTHGGA